MRDLEFVTDATDATDAGEVVSSTAARTPPSTRAGGQDDGSYTNSLKKLLKRHIMEAGPCTFRIFETVVQTKMF